MDRSLSPSVPPVNGSGYRVAAAYGGSATTIPWRRVGLGAYIAVNLALLIAWPDLPTDWDILWARIPDQLASGDLYTLSVVPFVWSPVAAWLLTPILAVGFWPYLALHIGAVALLRSPWLIALVLSSWAFWVDAVGANTMTFVVVAGILALRGSRGWALVYLALLLLMPRPIQLPLAAWLLWQDRSLWRPFAIIFAAHSGLVLASGYAVDWFVASVVYAGSPGTDYGPTSVLGRAWLLIGVPLAALLTWRGYAGVAGLAMSPYILPQYMLILLLDLMPEDPRSRSTS